MCGNCGDSSKPWTEASTEAATPSEGGSPPAKSNPEIPVLVEEPRPYVKRPGW